VLNPLILTSTFALKALRLMKNHPGQIVKLLNDIGLFLPMVDLISKFLKGWLKKPIKIGIIANKYPTDKISSSGAFIHTMHLTRNLASLGTEVHVFCAGNKNKIIKERIGEGKLIIHVLGVDTGFGIKNSLLLDRIALYTFEVRALNAIMYENSRRWFDIIHSQSITSTGFMLKHFSNMNWVHTFHSLDTKRLKKMEKGKHKLIPVQGWADRTVLDADRVITVSNKFREEVIREIKGTSKNTVVIPNGINLNLFKPSKRTPLTVLYIGRFSKEKGVCLLPEVIEKVLQKDKRYKFIMVATLNNKTAALKTTQNELEEIEKKYPGRFTWHKNTLGEEEIVKLHKDSGVYIQPSMYETFGICVLEAMASGNPVIVTNVGGMPELVGNAGLIADKTPKDLSKKIINLLKNPSLRRKLGKRGITRAQNYCWKLISERTLDLYKEIIVENSNKMEKRNIRKK
jgi:glycosyltransferase involved in cell wall biosynthesis